MIIETLPFEHKPRNSIANNLDKINELVDWVNQDTHLYASATGESVTVDDASSVKGLKVDGRSVQDGTPTPDAPVEVQVVEGRNLLDPDTAVPNPTTVRYGITITRDADGWFNVSGASTSSNAFIIPIYGASENSVIFEDETYTLSVEDDVFSSNTLRVQIFNGSGMANPTITTSNGHLTVSTVIRQIRLFIPATSQGVKISGRFRLQLEKGSAVTPYTPYGSIGIVVGDAATPIDLQGNTLASLPDGTRDELHVDSAGHVWIEKNVGVIVFDGSVDENWGISGNNKRAYTNELQSVVAPSSNPANIAICNRLLVVTESQTYNGRVEYGISINSNVATTNTQFGLVGLRCGLTEPYTVQAAIDWLSANPLTLYYELAATTTIDLGYIAPPAIPSGSVVTVSASLTPTFHLEWWVDDGITELVNDLIAYIDYKTEG